MWLITPIGFFSVVQKAEDKQRGTLTIRARVKSDLETLKKKYLPTIGPITDSLDTDYRFRAIAPRADVAKAMASFIENLDYANFKNEVAKVQGHLRAHVYHDVWSVLYGLQDHKTYHPRPDEYGKPVVIKEPSTPSPLSAWKDNSAIATVIPDGLMPESLHGIGFESWIDCPEEDSGWEALVATMSIEQPPFNAPSHLKKAAGVVTLEPDGRVWVVAPSNGYAGYEATFPKGGLEGKSAKAAALVEAYEESGLKVRLTGHLLDMPRSTSYTRYYLAERVGGNGVGDTGGDVGANQGSAQGAE